MRSEKGTWLLILSVAGCVYGMWPNRNLSWMSSALNSGGSGLRVRGAWLFAGNHMDDLLIWDLHKLPLRRETRGWVE